MRLRSNRLTSVTDNEDYTAAYTYAPDGTRIRAQESSAADTDESLGRLVGA